MSFDGNTYNNIHIKHGACQVNDVVEVVIPCNNYDKMYAIGIDENSKFDGGIVPNDTTFQSDVNINGNTTVNNITSNGVVVLNDEVSELLDNDTISDYNNQGDIGVITSANSKSGLNKILQFLWDRAYKVGLINDYVIEQGSNENGDWEKWASGKLVQRGIYSATMSTPTASGTLYYNTKTGIPFPISFYASNDVVLLSSLNNVGICGCRTRVTATTTFEVLVWSTGTSSRAYNAHWQAVGRWKA